MGIGGLYDSTNIVPRPVVTGITALGLDHTAVLGNTIEEIARNKAGIYKPGIPALTVKQDQASAQQVLREVAERVGAAFEVIPSIPETDLGLKGKHQTINASLAVALAKKFLSTRTDLTTPIDSTETLPESFRKPLAETRWPGRCQVVKEAGSNLVWYLDGAHTVESLTSCGEWAWSTGKPNVLIFNCSGGRAGETLLRAMLEAGAKQSRGSVVDLGMAFDSVVFCTNVTYADGHFKGGECLRYSKSSIGSRLVVLFQRVYLPLSLANKSSPVADCLPRVPDRYGVLIPRPLIQRARPSGPLRPRHSEISQGSLAPPHP